MRPFFPYYGSKWNIARYYPPPTHPHVVEPFAGGAGYSVFYAPEGVTLVERDPIVAGLWRYLIGVSPAEILALPELPAVGDTVDNYPLAQEAKWLIGFWLNRGSATPKKSRTAYSARTDKAQLNWGRAAKERVAQQVSAIRGWRVVEGDYSDAPVLAATYFVDPPYGDKGRHYRCNMVDFANLAQWCQYWPGQVIVCEHPSATWLPFVPLGAFKSSKGRAEEAVYVRTGEADAAV